MRGCSPTARSMGMGLQRSGRGQRFIRFFCCLIMLWFGFSPRAYGDPVFGEVYSLRHPDGTRVDVRVWGDEFYRVLESLDGYTLAPDPISRAACYARLSADGNELISTGVPVEAVLPDGLDLEPHIRINSASAKAKIAAVRARFAEGEAEVLADLRHGSREDPPCNGDVQGIVLLVDFSDEVGTIPPSNVDDYCNQVGYNGYGNNGSIRDYFYDVSDGHLTYTNFVPDAYYRALHPRDYYEDPDIPYGTRARELIIEALTDLDNSGFDFSQYDSNGDGLVDAVNCFYAGTRYPYWAQGLWPHSWTVYFAADGVETYRYQITDIGDSLALRTFCHENGHMICYWPDLYDYGYESSGVGRFCVMCYGTSSTNPQEPCAYMKYIAGWSTTTVLTAPQTGLTVLSDVNMSYKFEHPTKDYEYYMIENRQRFGRDSGLPDAGLAIWHVDTRGSNNNEQQTPELHYLVTLVQADGDWDLENGYNYGDSTDLWKAPTYTECTPSTDPNTNWWDGSISSLAFTAISTPGSTMTFDFSLDCNNNGVPDDQDISEGTSLDCNSNGVPDECELGGNDCNFNTIPDDCDIAAATSEDCNANGVPDECDTTGGGVLLDEDFESGLPAGWSTSGMFQITDHCGAADPDCGDGLWAYSGDTGTCNYGDYAWDELVALPATLGYGLSELRFCSRIETEDDWDWGRVWVNGSLVWQDSGGSGIWEERIVDLRDLAGQTVTIAFEFTSDSNTSGWLGWQVDNVYVSSGTPDCTGNGIPDECEPDCNGNGRADSCDIADGISQDSNGNGIPDECETVPQASMPEDSLSVVCTDDAECANAATCIQGVCYAPKNRYVSVRANPNNAGLATARRISLHTAVAGTVTLGWVGSPNGDGISHIQDTPEYRDWSLDEPTIHVTECEIAPGQTYLVQGIVEGQSVGEESNYSEALALPTAPIWGDVVSVCPNDVCAPPEGDPFSQPNIDDVLALVNAFQGVENAPLTWLDIDPAVGDGYPEGSVVIGDVLEVVNAFVGQPYPGLGPLGCGE